jgi:hypothetical protein
MIKISFSLKFQTFVVYLRSIQSNGIKRFRHNRMLKLLLECLDKALVVLKM